ncbi:M48 metallopeptidase family protein [Shewanella marina]|uniref:M48 metallopeptidase family protein n=1 Tax=Shewanella marina TaxID=487319 RepID=UPI000471ADB8|nr:M48 family metallopeptidase [Shewanella marina]
MTQLTYLNHYPDSIKQQVLQLIEQNKLGATLKRRYPQIHQLGTDKALYQYTQAIKQQYLKQAAPLSKVIFDDKISLTHQALGLHSYRPQVQGAKTKTKNEIRISARLKRVPEPLLRMVVVHEIAHLKEKDHNKSFYKLCCHMEPDYHQLEFDLRLLLTAISINDNPY